MGAAEFVNDQSAKTAEEAFKLLRKDALHWHGHAGYTGTIAEKRNFKMLEPKPGETPRACIERCQLRSDHWSQDKFGPAACLDGGPDPARPGCRIFYFFGNAPC